jgi:hypothetical protein
VAGRRWDKPAKGTIVLIACSAALLITIPIAAFLLPLTKPQTTDEARREISAHMDAVVATVPAEFVISDDETSTVAPCTTDAETDVVKLRRVLVLDPEFDRTTWPQRLRERFGPEEGWHLSVRALDLAGTVLISLRGSDLSLVTVRSTETAAGGQLTMTAWSECPAG